MLRMPSGNREGFLNCLRHLYKRLHGYTLWLYVDRARWHCGEEVEIFLREHKRLRLRYLPAYQPGLNVVEHFWHQVRYETTTNGWFEDLDMIWERIQKTTHSWSPNKIKRLCKIT